MMNKVLVILLLAIISLTSCLKDSTDPFQEEKTQRDQYLLDNNITTEPTASGLYYIETLEGAGASPTQGILVKVAYNGKLLNGQEFDSGEFEYRFDLNYVIPGFDEAISYMKKGGKATAIIPSYLAYGANSVGSIPSYSTLVFELELIEVYGEEKEIEDRNQYLLDNNIDTQPTESGLYYIETLVGTGETPDTNDVVKIGYEGKYLDGTSFDSDSITYTHGTNQLIPGLEEGIGYMRVGGKSSLIIPSELGHGPIGGNAIPGYTTLIFDIELISITK
jgi:FKBP-type peptidyl-prolyl cis-trans isomerase